MFLLFPHAGTVCNLHSGETPSNEETILCFNVNSLKKCQDILEARKGQNLKYSSFILPEKVDNTHGYHLSYYRRFVALSKAQRMKMESMVTQDSLQDCSTSTETSEKQDEPESTRTTRSEITSPKPSSRTGIFPNACLFCDQARKKVKGVEQKLISAQTKAFEESIRKYIKWMEDSKLNTRLTGIDFSAKEVKYHAHCRVKYQTQAEVRQTQREKCDGESS